MKVAIVCDDLRWAQGRHALGLKKYAPEDIEVDVFRLAEKKDFQEYNAVYQIYLAAGPTTLSRRTVSCVASHAWMYPTMTQDWRTRGVNNTRNSVNGIKNLRGISGAICRNMKLLEWAAPYCREAKYIPAGVDDQMFAPVERPERKMRIGWCGQVAEGRVGEFKGYKEIYLPLSERLGDRYEFIANTVNAHSAKNIKEMRDFYQSVDVFICTSCADGTPNPPFEAGACGCVVVSTDVGQVSDWHILRGCGLIVDDYGNENEAEKTIQQFSDILGTLESSAVRKEYARAIRHSIEFSYSYSRLAKPTLEFVCGY